MARASLVVMTLAPMLLGLGLLAAPTAVGGADDVVEVSLLAERGAVAAGGSVELGVRFELEPTWHVYWANPGEAGLAPTVTWDVPAGYRVGELEFPTPKVFDGAGVVGYGYEDEATLRATLYADEGVGEGPVTVTADVRYLVCDPDVCVPGSATLSLTLDGGDRPADATTIAEARAASPVAETDDFGQERTDDALVLTWAGTVPAEVDLLPMPTDGLLIGSATVETTRDLDRLIRDGVPADRILAWTGNDAADPALYDALDARGVEVIFGTLGGRDSLDERIEASGDDGAYAALARDGVDIIAIDRLLITLDGLDPVGRGCLVLALSDEAFGTGLFTARHGHQLRVAGHLDGGPQFFSDGGGTEDRDTTRT